MNVFKKLFNSLMLTLVLSFSSCGNNSSSLNTELHYYSVDIPTISHRGYHVSEIENTEGAFLAAAERNFIGIETDVRWTNDGIMVCNHDENLINMEIPLRDLTYDEISNYNLSEDLNNPVYICTFTRYLEICRDSNKMPVIEFKDSTNKTRCEELVQEIQRVYDDELAPNKCMFITFDLSMAERIRDVKESNEYIFDIYLLGFDLETAQKAVNARVNASILHDKITPEIASFVQDNNYKLSTWTVNDEKRIPRLKNLGVVAVTSDILECDPKYCY